MDENNNRNFMLAIALSLAVLIAWQFLYAGPKLREEQQRRERIAAQQQQDTKPAAGTVDAGGAVPAQGGVTTLMPRETALAGSPRIAIETPALTGTIALKGARIDDLVLVRYRDEVDVKSANVVLFSPSGTSNAYYAEYGFIAPAGVTAKLPGADTLWTAPPGAKLTDKTPLTLTYDNGAGLQFSRTISIDENYMFTIKDEVRNSGTTAASLFPYALVSRHGEPKTLNQWVIHEGMIGVLSDEKVVELDYAEVRDDGVRSYAAPTGWLGMTDKYWAAVLVPGQGTAYKASFKHFEAPLSYQADFVTAEPIGIAVGEAKSYESHLFAGAKNVRFIDSYKASLTIPKFEYLIDWGWFYFITKPLFYLIDWLNHLIGNFGLAMLAVTVIVKAVFYPLASRSYASMSKMKKLQPEMQKLQERYKDDKVKQQQELMELYKREKVNPVSGCLPVLLQIPVFFALYKVLFTTIEMRHAPFFGWIQDLSAHDPTSIFNLFGLLPWAPPETVLLGGSLGIWPLLMGVTMWLQMKLNPAPPDPMQQKIFAWMPVMFTVMLAPMPAGLVIYWAWNNLLSIIQQSIIMKQNGVDVTLWDNVKEDFGWIWQRKSSTGKP